MERDIEKDLLEIECAIKEHEERDNTFTVSVLQRCHELVSELKKNRDLEEQGLLLKLPCKVGDTVYTNTIMLGWNLRKKDRPYKLKVVFIGTDGTKSFMNVAYKNGHMFQFDFSDIGKTVFLTQKEAEETLKNMTAAAGTKETIHGKEKKQKN